MASLYDCGNWRDARCGVPGGQGRHSGRPSKSPCQDVQLALVRLIFRPGDQAGANGVANDVIPFRVVVLAAAQLRIPEMSLPDRYVCTMRPVADSLRFPKTDPALQGFGHCNQRGTEQMNVIRHDDVSANEPVHRVTPGRTQNFMRFCIGEDPLLSFRTNGYEHDNWRVEALMHRLMDRMHTS